MPRVYVQNGNIVTASDIRISQSKYDRKCDFEVRKAGLAKYNEYAAKQVRQFMSGKFD